MTKTISILILLFATSISFSQDAQKDEWIRVQSDNGEFSIEIPKKYNYFYSEKGVSAITEVALNQMNLLTAYNQNTMVSVEFYKENKSTLSQLYEKDNYKLDKEELKEVKFEKNGVTFRQFSRKNSDYYIVRQYFSSKDYIYILTAASRNGETESMNHFFDSVILNLNGGKNSVFDSNIQKFTSLLTTPIDITSKNVKPAQAQEMLIPKNATKESLLTIFKPGPSFTSASRQNLTQGSIQLRIFCLETGFVNKIEIISSLPNGLTWQVISSVIRSKFLPQEKNGVTEASQGVTEYRFSIG